MPQSFLDEERNVEKKQELELYVHIPFCVKKCAYCDFLSWNANEQVREEYVDTLICEIKQSKERYKSYQVSTIFIGGGTPSILSAEQIERIFEALRANFQIEEKAEITIEANPGTVTKEKAETWKRIGINRISIGLQSVKDEELKMLGRIHTYQEFQETYRLLRKMGFSNLNIDLISAIPGQDVESWEKTLRTAAELSPEHISAYSLIIEEGTPFYQWYGDGAAESVDPYTKKCREEGKKKRVPLPDEEEERKIYEETEEILKEYGYVRYEISNYAKPGYMCRHNIGYWKRTEYLGIGLGASSLIKACRFQNHSDYDEYQNAVRNGKFPYVEEERLTAEDEMEEFMFLGLRMTEGITRTDFQNKFGKTIEEVYGKVIQKLEKQGLLICEGDRIFLTKRGVDISNYVFGEFLL